HLDAVLAAHHVGARALHDRDPGTALVEVLGDVMSAVTAADDDGALAGVSLAAAVRARGAQASGERLGTGNGGHARHAGHAGREDDVPRMEHPLGAVAIDSYRPASCALVVVSADEAGLRPHVQLERVDVRFEPAREL